jgi:hypothetical protein
MLGFASIPAFAPKTSNNKRNKILHETKVTYLFTELMILLALVARTMLDDCHSFRSLIHEKACQCLRLLTFFCTRREFHY